MKRPLPAKLTLPIGLSLLVFSAFIIVRSTVSQSASAQEESGPGEEVCVPPADPEGQPSCVVVPSVPPSPPEAHFVQPVTEVVEIGSGFNAGTAWNFEAYQALVGSGPAVSDETTPSSPWNALCIGFTYPAYDQTPETFDCFGPVAIDDNAPITLVTSPDNAYFGMTPPVTEQVRLDFSTGASSAALFGPFPELGLPVKFYVGFAPTTQSVSITGTDSMGNQLWAY